MESTVIRAPTAPFPSVDSGGGSVSAPVTASGIHGNQPQSIAFNLNVTPALQPGTSPSSSTLLYAPSPQPLGPTVNVLISLGAELGAAQQDLHRADAVFALAFERWRILYGGFTGAVQEYQGTLTAADEMNEAREQQRHAQMIVDDVHRRIMLVQSGPVMQPAYTYPPMGNSGSPSVTFNNSPFNFQNQQTAGNTGIDWCGLFKKILNLVSCGKLFPGSTF
ncbi:hypothetical protein CALCODRAFT_510189 [Calocera cornea HHB12733]|uniref:Uncharacterized protein n=1 Tax=Calocera cornea HHB12733 TaxID=1353952 RepID=A0A165EQ51_9BASI|nr:hypothetical protein CALCODRAFT_510189 [Calocera cornea HHB12733]